MTQTWLHDFVLWYFFLTSLGRINPYSWEQHIEFFFINWQAVNMQISAWPQLGIHANNNTNDWQWGHKVHRQLFQCIEGIFNSLLTWLVKQGCAIFQLNTLQLYKIAVIGRHFYWKHSHFWLTFYWSYLIKINIALILVLSSESRLTAKCYNYAIVS